MPQVIDKARIEQEMKILLETEPEYVQNLIVEINQILEDKARAKLEQIVKEDFDEHGDVFKALA